MTKQPNEQYIYIFEVVTGGYFGRKPSSRTLALLESSTLYTLARTILKAFNFDSDHLFGFYNNVYDWTNSEEVFEFSGEESNLVQSIIPSRDVKKVRINECFDEIGKEMLFLYDYGDEWQFFVEFTEKGIRIKDEKYPAILKWEGKAPRQYGPPDSSEMEIPFDECQKALDEFFPQRSKKRDKEGRQKTLDELS